MRSISVYEFSDSEPLASKLGKVLILLTTSTDEAIQHRLESYSKDNEEHWSFRGKAVRAHVHAYLQYPAMMVPQMQGELIRTICEVTPEIKSVYDPFMGSGTIMTESMIQGLDFTGQDINPLAVLICNSKKGPFFARSLRDRISTVISTIKEDQSCCIEVDFPNLYKWFRHDVAIELSRIKRAIHNEDAKWSRRFFWLALAETVRLTSNSRTSTFKLHIRPKEEIERRGVSPIGIFEEIVSSNFKRLCTIKQVLEELCLVEKGHYRGLIEVRLGDSASTKSGLNNGRLHDLLVTSPPYGDNVTTVPYGQYSYLPLQWIDLEDIDKDMDPSWLVSTHEIDSRSLGGTKTRALDESSELRKLSKTFDQVIQSLGYAPRDRAVRVAAFCRDLNRCLDPILSALKPNAYMIWTIGNRRVEDRSVPMDDILSDLLTVRGSRVIARFQRAIPSKRMAVKNNIARTMHAETVLIMKKDDS